jgi:RNA polymerase sigma-70 factor (ECF subfamily)
MDEAIDDMNLAFARSGAEIQHSDDHLVATVIAGDDRAFEELFIRHRYRVARIASRFFSHIERIEDITQEVFTKIYFALPEYSSDRGASFLAWLSRITVNQCYDQLRHDRRRPENAFDSITEEEAVRLRARLHPAQVHADSEASLISRDLADKLLANLNADDRIVLALLDIDGCSVAEIAEITGWSKSKIKVRTHRARASLRRILKEYV